MLRASLRSERPPPPASASRRRGKASRLRPVRCVVSECRDGLAIVDKAAGVDAHDVVAKARGLLGTRKIGHSGTLDPDATGVLLLGVGKVTRLLRYLGRPPRPTRARSSSAPRPPPSTPPVRSPARGTWRRSTSRTSAAAAAALTGDILQVPPMVSAVQVDGRRLHELAREGIEVEREPRPVTVHRSRSRRATSRAASRSRSTCSSGTYIRSLAADLGAALGGGAHLRDLRRTAIGSFTVDRGPPSRP